MNDKPACDYCISFAAERDRLRTINAELVAALKTACIDLDRLGGGEWAATYRDIVAKAEQVRS